MANENKGYHVEKAAACNGCKFLNFYRQECRRNDASGKSRETLNTFTSEDGYITVIRPTSCDYQKEKKQAEDNASAVTADE